MEEQLAHEFAPLIAQGFLVSPGESGQAELRLPGDAGGAAGTRYGGVLEGAQSSENFLLAQSPPSPVQPQRLVVAVTEGNDKWPVSVLGGTLALSELYRRVCGAGRRDNLEDDVRVALAEAVQRLADLERQKPPHPLQRWRFDSFFQDTPSALQGLASSLTAVAVSGRDAVLAHVGETQAYLLRAHERSLVRLSADHTVAGQAARAKHGALDPESLARHGALPCFVLGGCQLADLQIEWLRLAAGDTLLLCTSSLRPLEESQLAQIVQECEPAAACACLLSLAPAHRAATVAILRVPD